MSNIFRLNDVACIENHFRGFDLTDSEAEQVTYLLLEGDFDPKGSETVIQNLATFDDEEGDLYPAILKLIAFGDDARLDRCMKLLISYAHENMI